MITHKKTDIMFVGVDVHKDTHTAVGISPFGEKIFEVTIGNYKKDFEVLSKKVEGCRGQLSPFFGLEDCDGYGARLATFLTTRYPVVHVSPILVDRERKRGTHPEKSDSLDACGVAEVMIRKIDKLPLYTVSKETEKAKHCNEISRERSYLVGEQTRIKNRLHGLLHQLLNSEYREKFKDPFSVKALSYWQAMQHTGDPFLVAVMKRHVKRLIEIRNEIKGYEELLGKIIEDGGYTIQTANGCGTVIAATIIGEVGNIERFRSPAALAKYAGCAPRECSSGKTRRYCKTRSGNRRLNYAFHRMALSQISGSGNDRAKEYFKRKVSEGKTKSQALVCLRRHMVTIVWNMMRHKTEYRCVKN